MGRECSQENLVAFAKALDLALKKVSILRLPELAFSQRNMDFFCVRRQSSRHNHFQFGNPERVTEIHPSKKVETRIDGNPHLRHYLFFFSGLKSLLDVSFQESPIQALIDDSSNLIAEDPPMFFPEL
jgi:hypothetical protein